MATTRLKMRTRLPLAALAAVGLVGLLGSSLAPVSLAAKKHRKAISYPNPAYCNQAGNKTTRCMVDLTQTPWGSALHPGCFYLEPLQGDKFIYDDNGLNVPGNSCAYSNVASEETSKFLPALNPGAAKLANAVTVNLHWGAIEPNAPPQYRTLTRRDDCANGRKSCRSDSGGISAAPLWGVFDDEIKVAVANHKTIVPILSFQGGYACTGCLDWDSILASQVIPTPAGETGVDTQLTIRRPFQYPRSIQSARWGDNTVTLTYSGKFSPPSVGWQVQVCGLPTYESAPDGSGCQIFTITASGNGSSTTWLTYTLPLATAPAPVSNKGQTRLQVYSRDAVHKGLPVDTIGGENSAKKHVVQVGTLDAVHDNANGTFTVSTNWPWAADPSQLATGATTLTWGCTGHGNLPQWELNNLRADGSNANAVCDGQRLWIPNYWSAQFQNDWRSFVTTVAQHLESQYTAQASPLPPVGKPTTAVEANPGNVDPGSYVYAVTYVTNNGESTLGPTSDSVTTDANDGIVDLTKVPLGPSAADIVGRNIYRAPADLSGPFRLVGTIWDDTTTVFTDNTGTADVGGTPPTSVPPRVAGCNTAASSGPCFASLDPPRSECSSSSPCYQPSFIYYVRVATGLNDEGLPWLGYNNAGPQLLNWAEDDASSPEPSGCSIPSTSTKLTEVAPEWRQWEKCMLTFYQSQFTYENSGGGRTMSTVQYPITEFSGMALNSAGVAEWAAGSNMGVGQNGLEPSWGCGAGCAHFDPDGSTNQTAKDVLTISKNLKSRNLQPPVFELQTYQAQTQRCSSLGAPCNPDAVNCAAMKVQVVTWLAQNRYPDGGRASGIGVTDLEVYHSDLDWATVHSNAYAYYHDWLTGQAVPRVADYNFFYGLTCH